MDWQDWVQARTGREVTGAMRVQSLWGGYGELLRVGVEGGGTFMLKRVVPPGSADSESDRRKKRSYQVEQAWYRQGAPRTDETCRVAKCFGTRADGLLLLEDLTASGFRPDRQLLDGRAALSWLASFHARFLESRPEGLWDQGTYWHLETRQSEWRRMAPGPLKDAAGRLDAKLRGARWQTLLHGDAKPANFLWRADGRAAAVDFQYTGPGAGIRDVAYFLDCGMADVDRWLDFYFDELRRLVANPELEAEWRALFPVAWADFCRFEQGWRGGGFPPGDYSRRMIELALLPD